MATVVAHAVVAHHDLAAFVAKLFEAKGMGADDARTVADGLVWADLRGVGSHGVSRVERYMRMIREQDLDPKAKVALEEKGPSLVVMRASKAAGPIAMKAMCEEAERRAKATGTCIGIVAQTTHTGAIGQYCERLARKGLASIVMSSGPPMMAYHGARIPSLSTSPLALGVPREPQPLVLDMATAVAALGRINSARSGGNQDGNEALPPGIALDKEGNPTTDPHKAAIAMPLGGAKGSGLSLMFECLTGLMVGVPILANAVGPSGDGRHRQNAMVIVIDIASLQDPARYAAEVERLAQTVKSLPKQEGFDELLLPGERGTRVAQKRSMSGVPVSPAAWKALSSLASSLGVPLPAVQ